MIGTRVIGALIVVLSVSLLGCDELVLSPASSGDGAINPFADAVVNPTLDTGGATFLDTIGDTLTDATGVAPDGGGGGNPSGCAVPGSMGCPCTGDLDCTTGLCVQVASGSICTEKCVASCPDGFVCANITEAPSLPKYVCVPSSSRLCRPCNGNDDCASPADPLALCVPTPDDSGSFCGASCSDVVVCPTGFSCQDVVFGVGVKQQCLPLDGQCTCSPSAIADGAATACTVANIIGACDGVRTCTPAGLTPCTGLAPSQEKCNGLDDDCDGETDEGFPLGGACDGPDVDECATGTWTCAPDGGSVLCVESGEQAQERCDGADNDCDGETDEDFPGLGQPCDGVPSGACKTSKLVCTPDGKGTECKVVDGSAPEICDGLDNDCDGDVDEGFECKPGQQDTATEACGACGTKGRTRVCTAACAWGGFSDFSACSGEGTCTPGQPQTETQQVSCGNCNLGKKTQQRTRTCTAACAWGDFGAWSDASSCSGSGCSPGEKKNQKGCGPCGNGIQYDYCTSSCTWTTTACEGGCQCAWNSGTNWRCCGTHKWQYCLSNGVWSTACASFSDGGNQCP